LNNVLIFFPLFEVFGEEMKERKKKGTFFIKKEKDFY
jgi:hypothetical protein